MYKIALLVIVIILVIVFNLRIAILEPSPVYSNYYKLYVSYRTVVVTNVEHTSRL